MSVEILGDIVKDFHADYTPRQYKKKNFLLLQTSDE